MQASVDPLNVGKTRSQQATRAPPTAMGRNGKDKRDMFYRKAKEVCTPPSLREPDASFSAKLVAARDCRLFRFGERLQNKTNSFPPWFWHTDAYAPYHNILNMRSRRAGTAKKGCGPIGTDKREGSLLGAVPDTAVTCCLLPDAH